MASFSLRLHCGQFLSLRSFDSRKCTAQSAPPATLAQPIPTIREHSSHTRCRLSLEDTERQTEAIAEEELREDDQVEEVYERETPLIGAMLEDIEREGQALTAAEQETGQPATEEDMLGVMRAVVDKYHGDMTEGTLFALAGYSQAAYSQGHDFVGETLKQIREEVLNRTRANLPAEMQLLDELVTMFDEPQAERIELIRSVAKDIPRSDGNPANLGSLRNTTTQMLEDMESQDIIIDRRLVVRLCLIREEIDLAAESLGQTSLGEEYHDMMSTSFRLLPMGPTAYVKEIVGVSNMDKRRALLERCIKDDFLGEQNEKDQLAKRWRREGRLMNTIAALLTAYAEQGLEPESPEVERLLDIKTTALSILEELKD